MDVSKQSVLDVLVRAMINEQDGYEFYLAAVERVGDPKGKRMFTSLAGDESEHLRILRNEYERVGQGQAFVDLKTARKTLPAQPQLKLFPEKSELAGMLRRAKGDIGALKVALEFELKGYQMYTEAGREAGDLNAAAVFSYLAQQENGHYELIQTSLTYLTDKGAWFFQELEKPMFEG